jgi:N-sulfoglucosamine sulfohydrolase
LIITMKLTPRPIVAGISLVSINGVKSMKAILSSIALAISITCPVSGAGESQRPNILFVLADDWGYGDASVYGKDWIQTPAIDRLAREGLRFDNAYTPNAKCAPSRASILTGRNPWQLKEAGNHGGTFPLEFKTYPESLEKHGYFAGLTHKGWAPGIALDASGQPRRLTGKEFNKHQTVPPTTHMVSNDYAANFQAFLEAAPKDGPWVFWAGIFEPHREYEYGSGVAKGGKTLDQIKRVPAYWPDTAEVRNDMLDYAYEVEYLDRHIGRMVAELEKRGLLENTLIVLTSDNGMPFPRVKGNVYEAANHMPLIVHWPRGIRATGRVVRDYVSLIDVASTFIEVAGLSWEQTGMAPTPGRSLTDMFNATGSEGISPQREHVLLGQERHDVGRPNDEGYPIRSIIKDGWLYLRNYEPDRWPACNPETGYLNTDGSPTKTEILSANRAKPNDPHWRLCFGKRPAEELFDLKNDPDCVNNLASAPAQQARRAALETQLIEELKQQRDPRMSGHGEVFDRYPYAGKERGLYDRYLKGEKLNTGWVNPTDAEPGPIE